MAGDDDTKMTGLLPVRHNYLNKLVAVAILMNGGSSFLSASSQCSAVFDINLC